MKQFQLKTITELTSDEQQHLVAGADGCGTCTCGCTCSCCMECNDSGIEGAKLDSKGNTKSLNKSAGD
jgi:hypothetical protein